MRSLPAGVAGLVSQIREHRVFRRMPACQQAQMYRAAHTLKPDDIEKLASANVKVQKSTADTFAEGGQFLPLDVWRKQGFQINEENISEEDKGFSEVFGPTVRLRIQSRLTAATTDVAATITLAQKRGLKRKSSDALPIEPAPVPLALGADEPEAFLLMAPAPSAKAEGEDSSSSTTSSTSSSSSSDSSSSDQKKKKKKSAKGKKKSQKKKKPTMEQKKLAKQRAAEAQQKQEEREQQRQAQRDPMGLSTGQCGQAEAHQPGQQRAAETPDCSGCLEAIAVGLQHHLRALGHAAAYSADLRAGRGFGGGTAEGREW